MDVWYLTDSKSRITREIHAVKKTREFHDNESENISGCGAYSRVALTSFIVRDAALIRGQRLIEGGAYSSKHGMQ